MKKSDIILHILILIFAVALLIIAHLLVGQPVEAAAAGMVAEATETADAQAPQARIDTSRLANGIVGVMKTSDRRAYAFVRHEGAQEYHYPLDEAGRWYWLPLQSGNGAYRVSVYYQSTPGPNSKLYTLELSERVVLDMERPLEVWLQPNIYLDWSPDMEAMAYAQNIEGDPDYVLRRLWREMTDGYEFDYHAWAWMRREQREGKIPSYTLDIERVWQEKKDTCYGLTALFVCQLRAAGIPAKMVHGYAEHAEGYHAWAEVPIGDEWRIIDISADVERKREALEFADALEYEASKIY